jgi:mRNA interferase MazF
MTDYKPGDVVLVPYPFGERAGGKKRPALVISTPEFTRSTGELWIAQITGRLSAPEQSGDSPIEGWKQANLLCPSRVRSRLATIDSSLVLRRLGELTTTDLEAALQALHSVLGP